MSNISEIIKDSISNVINEGDTLEKVREFGGKAVEKGKELYKQTVDNMAQERLENMSAREHLAKAAEKTKENIIDTIKEHPKLAAATAAGLAAASGAGLTSAITRHRQKKAVNKEIG